MQAIRRILLCLELFSNRAILNIAPFSARRIISVDRVRVMAGSCGGQTRHRMIAASLPSTHFPGAIPWSTTRLPTQTNLLNRRCPIEEQRLTRSAPKSHRCPSLRMSLMPRSQHYLSLRMNLTRACSRCAKVGRKVRRQESARI